jgi:hypothetical protein
LFSVFFLQHQYMFITILLHSYIERCYIEEYYYTPLLHLEAK